MSVAGTSTKTGVALFVVVIVGLPGAAVELAGLDGASSVWALGAITALIAVMGTGARTTAVMAVALSVATVLAGPASTTPWLALLIMGAAAAAVAFTARTGLNQALVMAPTTLGFMVAEPPVFPVAHTPTTNALIMGAVMLCATAWGLVVGLPLSRRVHLKHPAGISHNSAVLYAAVMGALLGIAAWFVADRQLSHGGAWMMMTILIVVQPYLKDTWSKTWQRAAGTVLGFAIAFAIASVVSTTVLLVIVGFAFVFASIWSRMSPKMPYWVYVTMLTPAIVLLEGSSTSVVDTDVRRLTFTLIGIAVSMVTMAILVPVLRAVSRRRGVSTATTTQHHA